MIDDESTGDVDEIAFSDALGKLLNEDQVPVHLLYQLSDLSGSDEAQFETLWPGAEDERRRQIVQHLVDITEDNFVVDFRPVFVRGLSDPHAPVRIAALDGLWDTTDLSLVDPIIDLLKDDPVVAVRAAAAAALAHFLLMSAWGELDDVPTEAIYDVLLAAYYSSDSEIAVRRVALEALGSVNSPEISRMIEEAYEGPTRELQLSALFAMGNSADDRWLPIVLDEMESPYEENRVEASRAAGNIGHSDAIPRLAELAYDEDREVAEAAIVALGEIGGPEVNEILTEMAEDPDLEKFAVFIDSALEDASWNTLDLNFGLFLDDLLDEEE